MKPRKHEKVIKDAIATESRHEIKIYRTRSDKSRIKAYAAHREADLNKAVTINIAANELIDFALDQKGF